jgi:hypothetical protein
VHAEEVCELAVIVGVVNDEVGDLSGSSEPIVAAIQTVSGVDRGGVIASAGVASCGSRRARGSSSIEGVGETGIEIRREHDARTASIISRAAGISEEPSA